MKYSLFIILSVIGLFVNYSTAQQAQCVIYINGDVTNSTMPCGNSQSNACPTLTAAVQSCESQQLTSNMFFIFFNGTYTLDSSFEIYNKQITLQGNTQSGSTLDLSGLSETAITIQEPNDGSAKTTDSTKFTVTDMNIVGLSYSFINSFTTISNVSILISYSSFEQISFNTSAYQLIFAYANDPTKSVLSVQTSTFNNIKYTGSEVNQGFLIYSNAFSSSVNYCTFENIQGNTVLFNVNHGTFFLASSTINASTFYQAVYGYAVLTEFNVAQTTFSQNQQANNLGSNPFIIYSLDSSAYVSQTTFSDLTGFGLLSVQNTTSANAVGLPQTTNYFAYNQISGCTYQGVYLVATQNTIFYVYNNVFTNDKTPTYLLTTDNTTITFKNNNLVGFTSIILYIGDYSTAYIQDNQITNSTSSSLVSCEDSNLYAYGTYNNDDSNSYSPLLQTPFTCSSCSLNMESTCSFAKPDNHTGLIVGLVIGGLALVALIIAGIIYYKKHHHRHHHYSEIHH